MNQDSTHGAEPDGKAPARAKLRASIDKDAKAVAEFATACLPVREEGDAILREVFVSAYEDAVSGSDDPFSRARLFGKARRLCARATERRRKEAHDTTARGAR
jgi:formiminotetrahydrofolate cyclodeaminase